jgi:hypothetical protein
MDKTSEQPMTLGTYKKQQQIFEMPSKHWQPDSHQASKPASQHASK